MGIASRLKKLTRKKVNLSQTDPETGEPFSVIIRKVRVGEVTALTGVPPLLFTLGKEKGESDEEHQERVKAMMMDQPELAALGLAQTRSTQRAVIALGVASENVVYEGETTDDTMSPEDFGDDYDLVYDAIVAFSSLPYSLAGGAGVETFPPGPETGGGAESAGEILRATPEPDVEVGAGGL